MFVIRKQTILEILICLFRFIASIIHINIFKRYALQRHLCFQVTGCLRRPLETTDYSVERPCICKATAKLLLPASTAAFLFKYIFKHSVSHFCVFQASKAVCLEGELPPINRVWARPASSFCKRISSLLIWDMIQTYVKVFIFSSEFVLLESTRSYDFQIPKAVTDVADVFILAS